MGSEAFADGHFRLGPHRTQVPTRAPPRAPAGDGFKAEQSLMALVALGDAKAEAARRAQMAPYRPIWSGIRCSL
ncbi:hypothetical protein PG991_013738 [Apiospora marii]|uniref:Uncharacterized protein n=1 Tax=Apiospora marii TaxID=335849 RepID=A0ABR1R7P8_9PEZI